MIGVGVCAPVDVGGGDDEIIIGGGALVITITGDAVVVAIVVVATVVVVTVVVAAVVTVSIIGLSTTVLVDVGRFSVAFASVVVGTSVDDVVSLGAIMVFVAELTSGAVVVASVAGICSVGAGSVVVADSAVGSGGDIGIGSVTGSGDGGTGVGSGDGDGSVGGVVVMTGVGSCVLVGWVHSSHVPGVPSSFAFGSKPDAISADFQLAFTAPLLVTFARIMLIFFGSEAPANGVPPSPAASMTAPFPSMSLMSNLSFGREIVVVTRSGFALSVDFVSVSA